MNFVHEGNGNDVVNDFVKLYEIQSSLSDRMVNKHPPRDRELENVNSDRAFNLMRQVTSYNR